MSALNSKDFRKEKDKKRRRNYRGESKIDPNAIGSKNFSDSDSDSDDDKNCA